MVNGSVLFIYTALHKPNDSTSRRSGLSLPMHKTKSIPLLLLRAVGKRRQPKLGGKGNQLHKLHPACS